ATRASAAVLDGTAEPAGPVGAGPQVPQGVLGGGTAGERLRGPADECVQGTGRDQLRALEIVQEAVIQHGPPHQLARRQWEPPLRPGQILLARPQQPREAAYVAGVE